MALRPRCFWWCGGAVAAAAVMSTPEMVCSHSRKQLFSYSRTSHQKQLFSICETFKKLALLLTVMLRHLCLFINCFLLLCTWARRQSIVSGARKPFRPTADTHTHGLLRIRQKLVARGRTEKLAERRQGHSFAVLTFAWLLPRSALSIVCISSALFHTYATTNEPNYPFGRLFSFFRAEVSMLNSHFGSINMWTLFGLSITLWRCACVCNSFASLLLAFFPPIPFAQSEMNRILLRVVSSIIVNYLLFV